MKLEKRKDMYRLGDEKGGFYFFHWQLTKILGFNIINKLSVEIILKEFCYITDNKISRKDNPERFIKINKYEIKNNRHYYY